MTYPLLLVIQVVASLYIFIVLLRFVLQLSRAHYNNPISQMVVRLTQPILGPMRRFIPSISGMDTSSLVLAYLVKLALCVAITLIAQASVSALFPKLAYASVLMLIYDILNLYFWAFIISVILSWVAPHSDHPAAQLIFQVTEPVYRLCRRVLPPLGGLDLSPILVFLAIQIAQFYLLKLTPYELGPIIGFIK